MKRRLISLALVFSMLTAIFATAIPVTAAEEATEEENTHVLNLSLKRASTSENETNFGYGDRMEVEGVVTNADGSIRDLRDVWDISEVTFKIINSNGETVFNDNRWSTLADGIRAGWSVEFGQTVDMEAGYYTVFVEFDVESVTLSDECTFYYEGKNEAGEPYDIQVSLTPERVHCKKHFDWSIIVKDEAGLPVQGVDIEISIINENGETLETHVTNTDSHGKAAANFWGGSFSVGKYIFKVTAGNVSESVEFEIYDGIGEPYYIDCTPYYYTNQYGDTLQITFWVYDEFNQLVPDAPIEFLLWDDAYGTYLDFFDGSDVLTVKTDSDGMIEINIPLTEELHTGRYSLVVRYSDSIESWYDFELNGITQERDPLYLNLAADKDVYNYGDTITVTIDVRKINGSLWESEWLQYFDVCTTFYLSSDSNPYWIGRHASAYGARITIEFPLDSADMAEGYYTIYAMQFYEGDSLNFDSSYYLLEDAVTFYYTAQNDTTKVIFTSDLDIEEGKDIIIDAGDKESVAMYCDTTLIDIYTAMQNSDEAISVIVKLSNATFTFDFEAIKSLIWEADFTDTITITAKYLDWRDLNEDQQNALINERYDFNCFYYSFEVLYGDTPVKDFGDGKVTVTTTLPYNIPSNVDFDVTVTFISDDGTLTDADATYENGLLVMELESNCLIRAKCSFVDVSVNDGTPYGYGDRFYVGIYMEGYDLSYADESELYLSLVNSEGKTVWKNDEPWIIYGGYDYLSFGFDSEEMKELEAGYYTFVAEICIDGEMFAKGESLPIYYTGFNGVTEPTDISLSFDYPDVFEDEWFEIKITLIGENGLPVQGYKANIYLLDAKGNPIDGVSSPFETVWTNSFGVFYTSIYFEKDWIVPGGLPAGTYKILVTAGDVSVSKAFIFHGFEEDSDDKDDSEIRIEIMNKRELYYGFGFGDYTDVVIDLKDHFFADGVLVGFSIINSDGKTVWKNDWYYDIYYGYESWFSLYLGYAEMAEWEEGDYAFVIEIIEDGDTVFKNELSFKYIGFSTPDYDTPEEDYTPGNLNGDDIIDTDDALFLLMYTFFPEEYELNQDCDFDGNGIVDDNDALYLLMYVYFPDDYPIS